MVLMACSMPNLLPATPVPAALSIAVAVLGSLDVAVGDSKNTTEANRLSILLQSGNRYRNYEAF